MPSLTGKWALVTGASSGVGQAVSEALGEHGANVILVGRRQAELEQAASRIRLAGGVAEVLQADLNLDVDIARIAFRVQSAPGKLDILVHSAGVIALGRIASQSISAFDEQYRCNARAPYLLSQALLPMLTSQKGHIVFVNSTSGLTARANSGAYAASKHALKAIAESLREEVNGEGVRVTSIYLGRTATPMQESIFNAEGRPYRGELLLQPQDVAQTVAHLLQLPPTAEVTDLAMRPARKSY